MNTIGPFTADDSLLLVSLYGKPPRKFHNVTHLLDVMTLWQKCTEQALWTNTDQALMAGIALGFHDAHYVVGSAVNEETSAAMARVVAKKYPVDLDRCAQLVLATKRHAEDFEADPDMALLLDIDVARLGRDAEEYDLATHEIRLEYRQYSDSEWKAGRSSFLEQMLSRKSIYRSQHPLEGSIEERARENMQRELNSLKQTLNRP